MKTTRMVPLLALLTVFGIGCHRNPEPLPMSLDTIRASTDTMGMKLADTLRAKPDTSHSNLPPMAKAVDPSRLAQFLPKMVGWSLNGEMEHEIQVHENFNRSRVAQTYTNGTKKAKVEINDFAYVPYLYDAWQKFKGTYLDDDNFARTETTTIAGYHAVQTMEKKDPHGSVTVFPGNRYVVTVILDGAENINDVRRIAESLDLKGLESLQ